MHAGLSITLSLTVAFSKATSYVMLLQQSLHDAACLLKVSNNGVQVNISDYAALGRNVTIYAKTIQCGEDMLSRVSCIRRCHACRSRACPVVL